MKNTQTYTISSDKIVDENSRYILYQRHYGNQKIKRKDYRDKISNCKTHSKFVIYDKFAEKYYSVFLKDYDNEFMLHMNPYYCFSLTGIVNGKINDQIIKSSAHNHHHSEWFEIHEDAVWLIINNNGGPYNEENIQLLLNLYDPKCDNPYIGYHLNQYINGFRIIQDDDEFYVVHILNYAGINMFAGVWTAKKCTFHGFFNEVHLHIKDKCQNENYFIWFAEIVRYMVNIFPYVDFNRVAYSYNNLQFFYDNPDLFENILNNVQLPFNISLYDIEMHLKGVKGYC